MNDSAEWLQIVRFWSAKLGLILGWVQKWFENCIRRFPVRRSALKDGEVEQACKFSSPVLGKALNEIFL